MTGAVLHLTSDIDFPWKELVFLERMSAFPCASSLPGSILTTVLTLLRTVRKGFPADLACHLVRELGHSHHCQTVRRRTEHSFQLDSSGRLQQSPDLLASRTSADNHVFSSVGLPTRGTLPHHPTILLRPPTPYHRPHHLPGSLNTNTKHTNSTPYLL
ncbi:hypothetical protein CC79DRAFT_665734 [Sarocladium strictum]